MALLDEAIVLDCGSGTIKAGFSNEVHPLCVFPSVLGRPRPTNNNVNNSNLNSLKENQFVFGEAALKKRGLVSLRFPIEHGIIVNWDDMEKLLNHTFFNELRINPQNESVFLSEAPLNPRANREKSAQVLFETFNIKSMSMASQSILALYSSGRTTGVVIESGEGVTHSVPIYDGYSIPQAILRLDLGGRDITDYLVKLLAEKGHKFFTAAEKEVVRNIKEKTCYIAQNYEEEIMKTEINIDDDQDESQNNDFKNHTKCLFELPDGTNLSLESERFRASEILFQPKMIGSEQMGLTELINESVKKTEIDIRRSFWQNIVLCGGNTMFDGLKTRLNKELSKTTPITVMPKVTANEDRKYCVWNGAAIISNLSSFRENWMTQQDWKENGPSRIHAMTPF